MDPELVRNYLEINTRLWNAKTDHHIVSEFYDNAGFLQRRFSLKDPEISLLGDIKGKDVLHLQCHFGQDTISLTTLGASATGLDFSDRSIDEAKRLAEITGSTATFVCADVYNAPAVLNRQYDLVFTSYGTIGWLPDMQRWAQVVADCLKPGGRLVFADFHPALWMFSTDFLRVEYSYFNRQAVVETLSGTYADREAAIQLPEIGWNHSLSEVFGALTGAGLRITRFEELDYSPYNCFGNMVEVSGGKFMIKGMEEKLPIMYTLEAVKAVNGG